MTGKVILICGRICSGKSCYAAKLREESKAVILSADEITLLLGQYLGDKHDEISAKVRSYLFDKSAEIARSGINVILDWGFWQKEGRDNARGFYASRGIPCELHYLHVSDKTQRENIKKRNRAVEEGIVSAYYVDENLAAKCASLFEEPSDDETDVRVNTK